MAVTGTMKVILILAFGVIFLSFMSDPMEHRHKRERMNREDMQCIQMAILSLIVVSLVIVFINFVEVILWL